MPLKIYPSIGIARVGMSETGFFVGPEIPGKPGVGWRVELFEGHMAKTVRCTFLVDTTGRRSAWLRSMGLSPKRFDKLVALVGIQPEQNRASPLGAFVSIEAMPSGWWYYVPLASGRKLAAFMTDADLVDRKPNGWTEHWQVQLKASKLTGSRIENASSVEHVRVCAAHTQFAETVYGLGWLTAGDAAMAFDPLSSAGIAKNIELSIRAADYIDGYLANSNPAVFADYANALKQEFQQYIEAFHDYYGREQRWRNSPFWKRRQSENLFNSLSMRGS